MAKKEKKVEVKKEVSSIDKKIAKLQLAISKLQKRK